MAARAAVTRLPAEMPAFFREAGDRLVLPEPRAGPLARSAGCARWTRPSSTTTTSTWRTFPRGRLASARPLHLSEAALRSGAGASRTRRRLPPVPNPGTVPAHGKRIPDVATRRESGAARVDRGADRQRRRHPGALRDRRLPAPPHHHSLQRLGPGHPESGRVYPRQHVSRAFRALLRGGASDGRRPGPPYARGESRVGGAGAAREAVHRHILEAHAEVETLYRLDRDVGFDPGAPADPATLDFAAERLAAGARMLAALWWSAWMESAPPSERDGAGG